MVPCHIDMRAYLGCAYISSTKRKGSRVVQGSQLIEEQAPPRRARLRIPARLRPFLRLAVVALIVVAADTATAQLSRRGGTLDFEPVTVLRIVSALTILRYPLAGFVFSLEVDKWDWFWLGMGDQSDATQEVYQHWDKSVDLICLGIAAIVVVKWPDTRAKVLALGAFAWRSIGLAVYFATDQRWLLIVFPNVFESIFLLYLIFRVLSGHQRMLYSGRAMTLVLLALLIPKVATEVFLHFLNDRPWNRYQLLSGDLSILDAWIWGGLLYLLPLLALVMLVTHAHGRATHGDPEVQVSAV